MFDEEVVLTSRPCSPTCGDQTHHTLRRLAYLPARTPPGQGSDTPSFIIATPVLSCFGSLARSLITSLLRVLYRMALSQLSAKRDYNYNALVCAFRTVPTNPHIHRAKYRRGLATTAVREHLRKEPSIHDSKLLQLCPTLSRCARNAAGWTRFRQ